MSGIYGLNPYGSIGGALPIINPNSTAGLGNYRLGSQEEQFRIDQSRAGPGQQLYGKIQAINNSLYPGSNLSNILGNFNQQQPVAPSSGYTQALSNAQNSNVNFGQVQGMLNQAQQQRNQTFAPGSLGRTDVNYNKAETQQNMQNVQKMYQGYSAPENAAVRAQGMQDIQQQYLTGLQGIRTLTNQRSLPASTAQAFQADLLKSQLQARSDMSQKLTIDQMNRKMQASQLLQQYIQADNQRQLAADQLNTQATLQENINRLGNPELGAQLQLQAQVANQNSALNILNQQRQMEASTMALTQQANLQKSTQAQSFLQSLLGGL